MIRIFSGKHISIHQLNDFFGHVAIMLMEHFDRPEYDKSLFILGSYVSIPLPEIRKQFPDHKIIVYQLEQLMALTTWQSVPYIIENIKLADEIWDYDKLNIAYLQEFNVDVNRFLPLLFSKNLERLSNKENPDIDVLFYGLINERRFKIFQKLQSQLYGKIKLAWVYGDSNMDKHIENSKLVLNLHAAEPWNRQEQVRMFYPLINGKTNISEPSQINNMPNEIIESSIDDMADYFVELCSTNQWKEFGLLAKSRFLERTNNFLTQEFKF